MVYNSLEWEEWAKPAIHMQTKKAKQLTETED